MPDNSSDPRSMPNPYSDYDVSDYLKQPGQDSGDRHRAAPPAESLASRPAGYVPWGSPPTAPGPLPDGPEDRSTAPTDGAPWGTPVAAPPPGQPDPWADLPRGPRPGRSARGAVAIVVAAVVAVALLGVGWFLVARTTGSSGGGSTLATTWTMSADEIADTHGEITSVDGDLDHTVLPTEHGWLVMVEGSEADATLASLDPASGAVQWRVAVPEGRCALTSEGAALACLTRENPGSTFTLIHLDTESGTQVGDTTPAEITQVPAVVVPVGDMLLTMSVTGTVTALDADGAAQWTHPMQLNNLDSGLDNIDVDVYEEAVLLNVAGFATIHATTAGEVTALDCRSVVATASAWACGSSSITTGYAPDGASLWTADHWLVDEYQRTAPAVVVSDGTGVALADPMTGQLGPTLQVATEANGYPSFVGTAEYPFITSDTTIALVSEDFSEVVWEVPIDDEYMNIATGRLIGDQLVLDADRVYGLDLATGEELWRVDSTGSSDVFAIDDTLVGVGYGDVSVYELP